ncbi:AraC family transcriptional regulator [Haloplasma contractile]|uniref:AraC-family transcriptional regulator protein n=1 Tax=Haloplasma contractile SSD-17B TaxID=1033810 RepID=F7Q1J3_9MOLU|nr:AraC family transcriptional regulator [Haloplasma contractile]ERJ12924.1 AraC-family transcriptional regulator protein [Haloplasma contractile SSD-17B]
MASNKQEIMNQYKTVKQYYSDHSYLHPSYLLEVQLLNAIESANEDKAKGVLDKINSLDRAFLAKNQKRSIKNSLICSCTLFTRAALKTGVNAENAFHLSDACIQKIETLNEVQAIHLFEYDMLSAFINLIKDHKKVLYSKAIESSIEYIQNNIFTQIHLNELADHVFLSPNYLSSKFKNEVGISISDFINKTKVEESKYMLQHTNTSIADITFLFNFCNQSYYTKQFKKHTGLSPREYRELRDKDNF